MQNHASPPQDARTWAMLCHLSALVGLLGNGFGFILAPLIVWLIKRNDHPFIDEQGKEALNFQITVVVLIMALVMIAVIMIFAMSRHEAAAGLVFLFVLLAIALGLANVALTIVASVKANAGEHFRYPFNFRFIS